MVSMKKFQVLLRWFHIITCKLLCSKPCALREKFSKRADGGHMTFNLFQLHGIGSKLGSLLLEVDLKVLQQGLLHLLVLQRWRFLLHLHLQFNKKNDVLLQVQQSPLLHQLLHLLHIAEALFVTSVKVVDMLLLNVLIEEPWL